MNEVIVISKKYRRIISTNPNLWQRISFWKKASDVELNSGKDLQSVMNSFISLNNMSGSISELVEFIRNIISTNTSNSSAIDRINESLGGCSFEYRNGNYYIKHGDAIQRIA